MTYTFGEVPLLDASIVHTEQSVTVPLKRDDLRESGRQKIIAVLEAHGIDVNDVLGVVVSGVIAYDRDKGGHYQVEGGDILTKIVPI